MYKNSAISLLLAVILGTCTAFAQSDWRAASEASKANCPDIKDLQDDVAYLSDTLRQGRSRGSKGHAETAAYIIARLKTAGCTGIRTNTSAGQTFGQSFTIANDTTEVGHNIIGILHTASGSAASRYIIVGAHYDGLGTIDGVVYPGADANASGVAALLAIAKAFNRQNADGLSYPGNIIFVAFDAYMDGREGSKAFTRALARGQLSDPSTGRRIRPENIAAMIDMDQIGSSLAPVHKERPDYLIAIGESSLATSSARGALSRCNEFYGTGLDICKTYYGSTAFTDAFYKLGDRKYFIRLGIPTIYFTSGMAPTTNKPEDNAQSLDYDVFRRRATLIFRYIEKLL